MQRVRRQKMLGKYDEYDKRLRKYLEEKGINLTIWDFNISGPKSPGDYYEFRETNGLRVFRVYADEHVEEGDS